MFYNTLKQKIIDKGLEKNKKYFHKIAFFINFTFFDKYSIIRVLRGGEILWTIVIIKNFFVMVVVKKV